LKRRDKKKYELESPSLLELLDQVEAEMKRLRQENKRRNVPMETPNPLAAKAKGVTKAPALGKGLAQLFGAPRRPAPEPRD
jgi:hypothetical protein